MRPPSKKMLAAIETFNRAAPVGTAVTYWPGPRGLGPMLKTTVRAPAFVMSDHASCFVVGVVGSVSIAHVDVPRELPILFNDAMVRRIQSGDKRQTRRPAKGKPAPWRVGDTLWVREAWRVSEETTEFCEYRCDGGKAEPQIDCAHEWEAVLERWQRKTRGGKWSPSIHMPRWASRITLRVTGVRTEPLQSMREEDALAEGFDPIPAHGQWVIAPRQEGGHWSARPAFAATWDAVYPMMPWSSNPVVHAACFERVE